MTVMETSAHPPVMNTSIQQHKSHTQRLVAMALVTHCLLILGLTDYVRDQLKSVPTLCAVHTEFDVSRENK